MNTHAALRLVSLALACLIGVCVCGCARMSAVDRLTCRDDQDTIVRTLADAYRGSADVDARRDLIMRAIELRAIVSGGSLETYRAVCNNESKPWGREGDLYHEILHFAKPREILLTKPGTPPAAPAVPSMWFLSLYHNGRTVSSFALHYSQK